MADMTDADFIERQSELAIKREFAKRFPTLSLEHFAAQRKGRPYVVSHHYVQICGSAADLVRPGFVQDHMLPPGRKRNHRGKFGLEGNGSSWSIRRAKAGRLDVWFGDHG